MNLTIDECMIPGTILKKSDMGNVTGLEFLSKIFFISDGVFVAEIKRISGLDTSTLQNWTKRGWLENTKGRQYDIDHVAHILIINMLRSCMQLDRIDFLVRYINGNADDKSDDIIRSSVLYDYICRTLDKLTGEDALSAENIRPLLDEMLKEYEEPMAGARKRLLRGLEIIVIAYYASLTKHRADMLIEALGKKN
jgi:hypothetical protein